MYMLPACVGLSMTLKEGGNEKNFFFFLLAILEPWVE